MTEKEELPVIYAYNDFRKYLIDYQRARQSIEKEFTKSEFSRRMQLPNTRSYFIDVINGKKVTSAFAERFISAMELDHDEAQYFRILVKFNQAERADDRELYFDQLINLNRTPIKVLSKKMFIYYKNYYNSVIRALLATIDFKDDYASLAHKVLPPISTRETKEAIQLLLDLKLIAPDENGFLRPTQNTISSPQAEKDEFIRQYQLSCLDFARDAAIRNDDKHRIIATNTISISERGYQRLIAKIEKFRSEVRALVNKDEDHAEKVYQMIITFMPVSK
jgi:uncharacterized protein (TIGR02147 family)